MPKTVAMMASPTKSRSLMKPEYKPKKVMKSDRSVIACKIPLKNHQRSAPPRARARSHQPKHLIPSCNPHRAALMDRIKGRHKEDQTYEVDYADLQLQD